MQFIKKLLGLETYVSELDQFLAELRERYPKLSSSQRAELAKYTRIYKLRDNPVQETKHETIWGNF